MRGSLVALTLFFQVCTIAVLFAVTGQDTQAFPMDAGYVLKDQNLKLVYFEGTPAQLTYEKMSVAPKMSRVRSDEPVVYKRQRNIRCERREKEGQSFYRCAVDLRKI